MKNLSLAQLCILLAITLVFVIASQGQTSFDKCVDNDINMQDPVVGTKAITVKQKLISLKARCRRGKLVDRKLREIRFFKTECWGNPPADYLEIQKKQRLELARMKKKYTVVEIACAARSIMTP